MISLPQILTLSQQNDFSANETTSCRFRFVLQRQFLFCSFSLSGFLQLVVAGRYRNLEIKKRQTNKFSQLLSQLAYYYCYHFAVSNSYRNPFMTSSFNVRFLCSLFFILSQLLWFRLWLVYSWINLKLLHIDFGCVDCRWWRQLGSFLSLSFSIDFAVTKSLFFGISQHFNW